MNPISIKISALKSTGIALVNDFPPPDWHFDFQLFWEMHLDQPYFQAFIACQNEQIAGIGNIIINGQAGWLGNFIVPELFRHQGIGQAITEYLIEKLNDLGCENQLLVATRMGEKLYEKLGFQITSFYHFYHPKFLILPEMKTIRQALPDDFPQIRALDRMATGENRDKFLNQFLKNAWIDENPVTQKMEGYFLPDLGNGFIVGINPEMDFRPWCWLLWIEF
jgi:predicted N-acetyltransferase YhbS